MEVNFWDLIGPIVLVLFAVNTFMGYKFFKCKRNLLTLFSGIINIGISAVFAWSIGPVILAIGVIQIFIGTMNVLKIRSAE